MTARRAPQRAAALLAIVAGVAGTTGCSWLTSWLAPEKWSGGSAERIEQDLRDVDSHDATVREEAFGRLVEAGDEALPAVRREFEEGDPPSRAAAARLLGHIGGIEDVPRLAGALEDASPEVRAGAAEALGALGATQAAPALARAVGDPSRLVGGAAQRALSTLDLRRDVPSDREAMAHLAGLLDDPREDVRRDAVQALRACSGAFHGYHYMASPEQRAEAAALWRGWLAESDGS